MSDDLKATMSRFYSEIVNERKPELIDELLVEDFVEHAEFPGLGADREGVKRFFAMIVEAFEGFRIEPDAIYADGEVVIARARMLGRHTGEFLGIDPTGREIDVPMIDIVRFDAAGKAIEHWGVSDDLAMLQQLGLDRVPASAV